MPRSVSMSLVTEDHRESNRRLHKISTWPRSTFPNPAGNGGFSGYLASDSNTNEFLTSTTMNKMLVGYPVDGEPAVDTGAGAQGEMFATTPVTAAFTQVAGTDGSTNPNTKAILPSLYHERSL